MKALWAIAVLALTLSGCASALRDRIGNPLPEALRDSPDRFIVVTVANDAIALSARAGSTPRAYGGLQNYVATSAARAQVAAIAHDYHLNEVAAWPIPMLRVHCVVFEISRVEYASGRARSTGSRAPRKDRAAPRHVPDDESGSGDNGRLQRSLRRPATRIRADRRRRSASLVARRRGAVAIVDTGIDVGHPELKNRIVVSRNFVDTDAAQFRRDRHGTEVRGRHRVSRQQQARYRGCRAGREAHRVEGLLAVGSRG